MELGNGGEPVKGELGKRIRAARCYAGISQVEFARSLGVSVGTLIEYEKGRQEVPSLSRIGMAARVVELTGVDEDFLMNAVGGPGV